MSYFTEVFDEVHDSLEFKGDAERAYAKRRTDERMTHDHKYGKYASQYAKDDVNNNYHDKRYNAKTLSTGDIYNKMEKHNYESNLQKQKAENEHRKNDVERHNRKVEAEIEAKNRAKADARANKFDMRKHADNAKKMYTKMYHKITRTDDPFKNESADYTRDYLESLGYID